MTKSNRILIALLVAANAALITVAVRHHRQPAPAQSAPVVVAPSTQPPKAGAPVVAAETVHSAGAQPFELLSAATTLVAWRADAGCDVSPGFAGTLDGGLNFFDLPAPSLHLLQIHVGANRQGWAVGANDAQCTPIPYVTSDGGEHWASATHIPGAWAVSGDAVITPDLSEVRPCLGQGGRPFSVAGVDNLRAVVICRHGVFRTATGGASWVPAGDVLKGRPASVSLTSRGRGLLVLAKSPGCAGVRIERTDDAGASWIQGPCISKLLPPVAASMASSKMALLVNSSYVFRTRDAGRTWT